MAEREVVAPAPGEAHRFADAMKAASARAQRAAGRIAVRHFEIAGSVVRVVLAGVSPDYLAPLASVPEPSHQPHLSVVVWDQEALRVSPPRPTWVRDGHPARGPSDRLGPEGVRCAFNGDSGVLNVLDVGQRCAFQCFPSYGALPQYERGAPLRDLLAWWMSERGLQLVHAAAVGTGGAGVLLAGRGGQGKSSTAAACLVSGLDYLSDDYTLVEPGRGERPARAHAIYRSLKLVPDEAQRLGARWSGAGAADASSGKHLFRVGAEVRGRVAPILELRAVVLPEVCHRDRARLRPASGGAAMRALAPSSLFQIPGLGREAFASMAALIRELPAYHLDLADDRRSAPALISTLVGELGADEGGDQADRRRR